MEGLAVEKRAIRQLERRYLNSKRKTYLACEEMDFSWTKQQVLDFVYLWEEGQTLINIANYLKRAQEEVLLLALDQATHGVIKPRKGGLIGG